MADMQQFNISLPDDIAQIIKTKVSSGEYADESAVICDSLFALKSREDAHYQSTLEGLADVEAGRVVAHEDVKKWAKSLLTDKPLPMPTS